jgi:hypothetical protein
MCPEAGSDSGPVPTRPQLRLSGSEEISPSAGGLWSPVVPGPRSTTALAHARSLLLLSEDAVHGWACDHRGLGVCWATRSWTGGKFADEPNQSVASGSSGRVSDDGQAGGSVGESDKAGRRRRRLGFRCSCLVRRQGCGRVRRHRPTAAVPAGKGRPPLRCTGTEIPRESG